MITEEIFTLEEVSQLLRVPLEAIQHEISSGRLSALEIHGFFRIRGSALSKYLDAASANSAVKDPKHFTFNPASNFSHTWPDGTVESYSDAYEGIVSYA